MRTATRSGRNALTTKLHNRRTLLLAILRHQPISRVRLSRTTTLSTTTVTNLVTQLIAQGVVQEVGLDSLAASKGAGRPPLGLCLVEASRFAVGVHIGVRKIRVGLCNLAAKLIDSMIWPVQSGAGAIDALAPVPEAVARILKRNGLAVDDSRVVGLGIGASGLVENETGVARLAPNLGWHDTPMHELVGSRVDLPITVDNNVRCMALGESRYGAGRHVRALAYIYASIGVGAGLVVDGQIYRGAGFGAGEIGHWTMLPHGGDECRCGNRGCLETLISEPAIMRCVASMPATTPKAANLQEVFSLARGGHQGLRKLLAERSFYAGVALANLVNVLNPELILLGGFLADGFDLFRPTLEPTLKQYAFADLGCNVALRPASFAHHGGEIGAAVLALDEFFFATPGCESAAV